MCPQTGRTKDANLFSPQQAPPDGYCVAHIDGGARGNPGPAGYGVVITDQQGKKRATASEYLGHQTNNYAEYKGLLAALHYAVEEGCRALKVVSDSELMVKQIRGEYKVKNPALRELHAEAKSLISGLEWFCIQHTLRGGNQEADRLANEAMDKGTRRSPDKPVSPAGVLEELEGVVRAGRIELLHGRLPEGTRVRVRVKR
jgi:ribonuclease HI